MGGGKSKSIIGRSIEHEHTIGTYLSSYGLSRRGGFLNGIDTSSTRRSKIMRACVEGPCTWPLVWFCTGRGRAKQQETRDESRVARASFQFGWRKKREVRRRRRERKRERRSKEEERRGRVQPVAAASIERRACLLVSRYQSILDQPSSSVCRIKMEREGEEKKSVECSDVSLRPLRPQAPTPRTLPPKISSTSLFSLLLLRVRSIVVLHHLLHSTSPSITNTMTRNHHVTPSPSSGTAYACKHIVSINSCMVCMAIILFITTSRDTLSSSKREW